MRLYYAPRTRSHRARWMLEELGEPYELVQVDLRRGEHRKPSYLAINPVGKVPALEHGEIVIFESAAICLYLGDAFPEAGLAPRNDEKARGPYLSWMFFATGQLEPSITALLRQNEVIPQMAWGTWERVTMALEAGLADGPWLLGERFSAADIMIGHQLSFVAGRGHLDEHKKLRAYAERAVARDAYQRAAE